jgi:hypothetical protein
VPTPEEITRHHESRPDSDSWVEGHVQEPVHVEVVEYDDRWPADFERVAGLVSPPSR